MTVTVRFFARFRELLGTDLDVDEQGSPDLCSLLKRIASKNHEGFGLIFDDKGHFRDYVILVRNGQRIETSDAEDLPVCHGDEIAVFPPVSGG